MLPLAQVLPPSASLTPDGHLAVGGCDLVDVADEFGTPLAVYDEEALRAACRAHLAAFRAHAPDAQVVYASKAYFGLAALRLVSEEGLGVDVASGGELHAALSAGVPAERIVMHGNNKGGREVADALHAGIGAIVVDSFDEIALLERFAGSREVRPRVLVRVTPGVKPSTHSYISTGQLDSKFGFSLEPGLAKRAVEAVRAAPNLDLVGLHCHLGSQLFDLGVYRAAARLLAALARECGDEDLGVMNMGGGLGIAYTAADRPPAPEAWADAVMDAVHEEWRAAGLAIPRVMVEPGRAIVGRAGMTLYRVGTIKEVPGVRTYAAVDGGMSDMLRPMLYGAVYEPLLANRADAEPVKRLRLVGKHCESGDVLVEEASLPDTRVGDLVCMPATGAYGLSMASNYNGMPRPAVVFVRGGDARLVTRRESYADLLTREV